MAMCADNVTEFGCVSKRFYSVSVALEISTRFWAMRDTKLWKVSADLRRAISAFNYWTLHGPRAERRMLCRKVMRHLTFFLLFVACQVSSQCTNGTPSTGLLSKPSSAQSMKTYSEEAELRRLLKTATSAAGARWSCWEASCAAAARYATKS